MITEQEVNEMGSDSLLIHDINVFDHAKRFFKGLSESKTYKLSKEYISKTHKNPCGLGLLQRS